MQTFVQKIPLCITNQIILQLTFADFLYDDDLELRENKHNRM